MAKLSHTAATATAITILVMNLERRLRPLILFFVRLTHRYLAEGMARLRAFSRAHWRAAIGDPAGA